MKYLNMNIECCIKCPFGSIDEYETHCFCNHPDGHQDSVSLRYRDGTKKNVSNLIHVECPLPDIILKLNKDQCPKCYKKGKIILRKCDGRGIHEKYKCDKCNYFWGDNF